MTATRTRWTPEMVKEINTAARRQPGTVTEIPAVGADEDLIGLPVEFRDRLGPDAARPEGFIDEAEVVAARHWLNDKLANPPMFEGKYIAVPYDVTPALATAMLETNIEINRRLTQLRVKNIENILRRPGEWKENGQAICFSINGQLMNGQTRLQGIIRSGVTAVLDIRFGLKKEAFFTMDMGTPRTVANGLEADGVANATTAAAGIRMLLRYDLPVRMARIDPLSHAQASSVRAAHAQFTTVVDGEKMSRLDEGVSKAHGLRGAIGINPGAAVFLWTLLHEHNEAKGAEFFKKLVTGADLFENHPILRFRNYLLNLPPRRRSKSDEMAALGIKAFNAFLETPVREIQHLRWTNAGPFAEPFPVVGLKAKAKSSRRKS